ncbi:unnamed protein product [Arctia plantaginis]|uniref:Uncharacterized protein n=1 Tax=Arctia plantaginis TaxID=874455 RepID=A0A8S1BK88_ARCPL|nr:unnamed protein product [Arctia plantaginis]
MIGIYEPQIGERLSYRQARSGEDDLVNQPQGGVWRAFQQLASIFFDTNFGINFMLYCLAGQKFREALCKSVPFLRRYVRSVHVIRAPCPPIRSISTSYASTGPEMVRMVSLPSGPSERQVQVRRHGSEPVIRRWTFDNSRQRLQNEQIELSTFENRRRRPRNEELEMPNFDNIRQLIPHEEFEMRNYDNSHLRAEHEEMEMAILSAGRDITPDLIRDTRGLPPPAPIRSIPFLLFPYRHFRGSRQAQCNMVTYN